MRPHHLPASLTLAAALLTLQPALAVDAHHPEQKAGAAAPTADQTIQTMQANAKKMQTQLKKIAQSKDPRERQMLMQDHMKTMQENMMMGKSMTGMDCPMMSGGMGGMGMMGGGGMGMMGGMGPDAMKERMQMMEKRMDMMQMMMEQMSKGQPASMPAAK
jgi:hypothetical protein